MNKGERERLETTRRIGSNDRGEGGGGRGGDARGVSGTRRRCGGVATVRTEPKWYSTEVRTHTRTQTHTRARPVGTESKVREGLECVWGGAPGVGREGRTRSEGGGGARGWRGHRGRRRARRRGLQGAVAVSPLHRHTDTRTHSQAAEAGAGIEERRRRGEAASEAVWGRTAIRGVGQRWRCTQPPYSYKARTRGRRRRRSSVGEGKGEEGELVKLEKTRTHTHTRSHNVREQRKVKEMKRSERNGEGDDQGIPEHGRTAAAAWGGFTRRHTHPHTPAGHCVNRIDGERASERSTACGWVRGRGVAAATTVRRTRTGREWGERGAGTPQK